MWVPSITGKGEALTLVGAFSFQEAVQVHEDLCSLLLPPRGQDTATNASLTQLCSALIPLWPTLKLEGNFLRCLLCLLNLSSRHDECKFHLTPPPREGGWGNPIPRFLVSEMQDREEKWVCIKSSFQKTPPCKMQPGAEQVSANVKIKTEKFLSKVECF